MKYVEQTTYLVVKVRTSDTAGIWQELEHKRKVGHVIEHIEHESRAEVNDYGVLAPSGCAWQVIERRSDRPS